MVAFTSRTAEPEYLRSEALSALTRCGDLLSQFVRREASVSMIGTRRRLLTVLVGEKQDEASRPRDAVTYTSGLFLEEQLLTPADVKTCFEHAQPDFTPFRIQEPLRRFTAEHWASLNCFSPWPGFFVVSEDHERPFIHHAHEPVTGKGEAHAYFPNMYTAAAAWCHYPKIRSGDNTRIGGVAIFIPDLRGRFGDVEFDGNSVAIGLTIDTPFANEWRVKGGYWQDNRWQLIDVPASQPVVTVANGLRSSDLALVDENGRVVDQLLTRNLTLGGRKMVQKPMSTVDASAMVGQCLERGECETVEFKPVVSPNEGHPKFSEIVRTVIAFANTEGGTLLIGVSDTGEVDDLLSNQEFRRWRKVQWPGDDAQALRQYGMAVIDVIRRSLDVTPSIEPVVVQFRGAHLVLVRVQTGTKKPYFDRNRHIYVRKGATNRVAHPVVDRDVLVGDTEGQVSHADAFIDGELA